MARRIHVPRLVSGDTVLDPAQAHHARDVLRLTEGATVEVFDDGGRVAPGVLVFPGAAEVAVRVGLVGDAEPAGTSARLTVAAAVPKGDRADWMVEKLSELGVAEFLPLAAARSVVLPEGKNKRERWVRIATEAAKQSRRAGVMRVGELTRLPDALRDATAEADSAPTVWFLGTEAGLATVAAGAAADGLTPSASLTVFVGPEGGWADEELRRFADAGARPVRLTETILRVETAAVAVAAVVACRARPAGRDAAAGGPGEP